MAFDSMRLWDVELLPLLFFGLVLPALFSGGFHPVRVKQKVLELSLPLGALGAWIGMVSLLQNLSDPSKAWPAFYAICFHMFIWGVIYGFAHWFPIKRDDNLSPMARNSLLPVLAVLSFIGGWWMSVAVSHANVSSFIEWTALGAFGVLIFLVYLWSKQQGQPTTVSYFAKASLRVGYLCLALSLILVVWNINIR